jgi:hypothetical protein
VAESTISQLAREVNRDSSEFLVGRLQSLRKELRAGFTRGRQVDI